MSLSWFRAGTPIFYNRGSANERVPAIILGPSQRLGDYVHIQYEVNGKAVVHDAAAKMNNMFLWLLQTPPLNMTCWMPYRLVQFVKADTAHGVQVMLGLLIR